MNQLYSIRQIHDHLAALQEAGYTFHVDRNGWRVDHGDRFVGGASVLLPRAKPLRGLQARRNVADNLQAAVCRARCDQRREPA